MQVMLIFECDSCGRQAKNLLAGVSENDQILISKRRPEGWIVSRDEKRREIHFCEKCKDENKT